MGIVPLVDLRSSFGEARSQGDRSTCMAFATSDCHSAARNDVAFLSPEFLHYNALRRRSFNDFEDGVSSSEIFTVVETDGQPLEEGWPYLSSVPDKVEMWKPPVNCRPIFKRNFCPEKRSVERIEMLLDRRQPVVIVMEISLSFYRPSTVGIVSASKSEPLIATHAVVAVGRGKQLDENLVLIRNSWGMSWGLDGHAWLASSYLEHRLICMSVAGLEV
jgi:C1A family cysteine protease